MRNRTEILKDIINFNDDLQKLLDELSFYPWDIEKPLHIITKGEVTNILKRVINEDKNFVDLENWANAIEIRDDLDFEDEETKEIVFELANPEINEKINKERLINIINSLNMNLKAD